MRPQSTLGAFDRYNKREDRLAGMCFDERMAEAMERKALLASRKVIAPRDSDLPAGYVPVKKTARPLFA